MAAGSKHQKIVVIIISELHKLIAYTLRYLETLPASEYIETWPICDDVKIFSSPALNHMTRQVFWKALPCPCA
jgi:hypothetical protein